MENITTQQPGGPVLLKKGDVVRMWYDCQIIVSESLENQASTTSNKSKSGGKGVKLSLDDAKSVMNIRLRGNAVPQNDAQLSAKAGSNGGAGQVFQLSMWGAV